jgi:hypothetical protein
MNDFKKIAALVWAADVTEILLSPAYRRGVCFETVRR